MFKFFVTHKKDNFFILDKKVIKHILVAHTENQKFICVYEKNFYICKLTQEKKALILQKLDSNNEFNNKVVFAVSLVKIKRFEWLIQKLTELGITTLIPMISKNVSLKINDNFYQNKIKRWKSIVLHACQQSFRNEFMEIKPIMFFDDVLNLKVKNKYIATLYENKNIYTLFPQESLFLIGPEGGFTKEEVESANKKNFQSISLGPRILKTETASLFLASRIKLK